MDTFANVGNRCNTSCIVHFRVILGPMLLRFRSFINLDGGQPTGQPTGQSTGQPTGQPRSYV